MAKRKLTFEEELDRLETIVSSLESGEFSLEKSLELFQEGVGLVKSCNLKLENIENSVKVLINDNGEMVEKDFEPNEQ